MVYVLVSTDGYNIGHKKFAELERAKEKMKEEYEAATPDDFGEEWMEMSYISDMDAILYANGEAVFVWTIIQVELQ